MVALQPPILFSPAKITYPTHAIVKAKFESFPTERKVKFDRI